MLFKCFMFVKGLTQEFHFKIFRIKTYDKRQIKIVQTIKKYSYTKMHVDSTVRFLNSLKNDMFLVESEKIS